MLQQFWHSVENNILFKTSGEKCFAFFMLKVVRNLIIYENQNKNILKRVNTNCNAISKIKKNNNIS